MKFVCSVCGYVYEGDAAPAECRYAMLVRTSSSRRARRKLGLRSHVVGVASDVPEDIKADLRCKL